MDHISAINNSSNWHFFLYINNNNMQILKSTVLFNKIAEEIKLTESVDLKVSKILERLEKASETNSNFNSFSSLNQGVVEMIDEMNKIEIIHEIEMAIKIIHRFQESAKFDLLCVPNSVSSDLKYKFELLNNKIKTLILS